VALTETQKAKVRAYLGWQRGYDLNSALEDKLANSTAEEEAIVTATLTRLDAIDTALDALAVDDSSRLVQVDEIQLSDRDPFEQHCAQGRRLIARLVALFGVEPRRDYYSDGGAPIAAPIPLG